jgi:hypothetical protein
VDDYHGKTMIFPVDPSGEWFDAAPAQLNRQRAQIVIVQKRTAVSPDAASAFFDLLDGQPPS